MTDLQAADLRVPLVEPVTDQPAGYPGLVTRAISAAIDAALITLVDIIIGVGAALILSLLHLPHELRVVLAAVGAVVYIAGSIAYFVVMWSTTGQTLGARLLQIQVLTSDGQLIKPSRGLVRCVGIVLAALPLFAGFFLILFDSKRRAFQDRFAGTVVVNAPGPSIAEVSRAKRREIYEASRTSSPALRE